MTFNEAIENAKLTGRLVAIALVLGYPFNSQTVSLIGFSLGSQVIKSCLSTLHKLGATDIIQNVTFLGGATHFDKNQEKWATILSSVVNGKIKNCYSEGDEILGKLYETIKSNKSIGRREIWSKNLGNKNTRQRDDAGAVRECVFDMENYEMHNQIGHMDYRDNMLKVVTRCQLEL